MNHVTVDRPTALAPDNNGEQEKQKPQQVATPEAQRYVRVFPRLVRYLPTLMVMALLAGLGAYGHHSGWKLPKFSALAGNSIAVRDDWCEEHGVPESQCVECHPDVLPRGKDCGWCKEHGVHDCPLCHPEVAQLKQTPVISDTDRQRAVRALASAPRSENNAICKNYRRRIQFASLDAVKKAGVDVALVDRQTISESVFANGQITYDQTRFASLSSRLPGTVWHVEKNVGDWVRAGEVLALVDAAEVGRAKTELIQALAQEELQKKVVNRLESLSSEGVVAGRQAQTAQTEYVQARARLLSAQQALANLGLSVNIEQLRGLPDEKLTERLRLLGLPENHLQHRGLDETTANLLPVKAPMDGIIVARQVVAGEVVDASRVLFQLADTSRMWLTLNASVEDAGKLAVGQPVRFRPDGNHGEVIGKLVWISTTADQQTRMVAARAELSNQSGQLRNETFGTGRIILREEKEAIIVPNEAIHWEGCCHIVFVRDRGYFDNKDSPKVFHVRTVRVGAKSEKATEIIAGVLPGEVVATNGSDVLRAELLKNNLGEGWYAAASRETLCSIGSSTSRCGIGFWSLSLRSASPRSAPYRSGIWTSTPFPTRRRCRFRSTRLPHRSRPKRTNRQTTFPVEQAISGLPGLGMVRSISKFGLSQVVVTFKDGTDIYFARQIINERLGTVELPQGIERPQMGPVSTGLGEVFHHVLTYQGYDFSKLPDEERVKKLTELRTIHDWVVKPQLRSVPGVAEVNSWGGYEKQYQIRIDPDRLIKHGLTFDQVTEAVKANNRNVGGGNIAVGARMLLVQGLGRTVNLEQIKNIVITAKDGVPIRVRDVADVQTGHEIRLGAVTAHGRGEAVLGLGFMLMGENSHEVTWALKNKLEEIRSTLPPGVTIQTVYDRTELVDHVIDTVRKNLFEGGLLVIAVLFLFLGNLRAGLIVAMAIPLSMLFAFSGMLRFGIAASLLSLGAIDFGLIVDSSVVMVENCVRHLAQSKPLGRSRLQIIRDAAIEVRKPTMFGELIIMIVYVPILALEGVEGKLFRPMALTVVLALAGSMVLSLTLMPVLASVMLPKRIEEREPLLIRVLKRLYAPVLRFTMHHKLAVLGFALCLLVVAFGMIAPNLGSEFIPKLSEGSIVVNVIRLAGIDLEESLRYNTQMEKVLLAAFPDEILYAWSRIGTAEVATDPMGVELSDIFITLRPRSHWKRAHTQDELTALIQKELRDMPGQRIAMTQPIEMRMNEMISGVRSDVAAILYGDDFDVLVKKAAEIERVLKSIPGAADVSTEQVTGQPILQVRINQDEIARYGIPANTVLDLVESLGSKHLGEVYEGQLRFPLVVRLPEKMRTSPETIGAILVTTPTGQRIPLSRLATIETVEGPSTIKREWYQRRITVSANVRNRDMGSFVAEARKKVADHVQLPTGRYRVEWGGQFENLERARTRLMIVVPVALALIFGLLYMTYRNVIDAVRVFTGVPFAWVGGIFALWIRDMPFSISAAVGFVALSGVAVLDDMLLVSYIRQLRRQGMLLEEAVENAAMTRLRPVLMTALVASLGFVPMAFNTGMGAEVQRPLATVVIGGVFSAMVMSLLVLRVLYMVFSGPVGAKKREIHQADANSRRVPELVSASFLEGGTDDGMDANGFVRDGDGGLDGRRLRKQRDEGA